MVKKVPGSARDLGSKSGLEKSPAGGNDSPVFLSGESHGQRSLESYCSAGSQRVGHK